LHRDNGPLSFRETEILTCAAVGKSNKQIAIIFGRSEYTIKNHSSRILKKLRSNDRTHAVTLALFHGWLPVLSDERGMEAIEPKNTKKTVEKKAVCETCGLDCGDKFTLELHIDWGHSLKIGIAP
jgi:DNA-binding CsgD family transcriptional regulator